MSLVQRCAICSSWVLSSHSLFRYLSGLLYPLEVGNQRNVKLWSPYSFHLFWGSSCPWRWGLHDAMGSSTRILGDSELVKKTCSLLWLKECLDHRSRQIHNQLSNMEWGMNSLCWCSSMPAAELGVLQTFSFNLTWDGIRDACGNLCALHS